MFSHYDPPGSYGMEFTINRDSTIELFYRSGLAGNSYDSLHAESTMSMIGNKLFLHGLPTSDTVFLFISDSVIARPDMTQMFVKSDYYDSLGRRSLMLFNTYLNEDGDITNSDYVRLYKNYLPLNIYTLRLGKKDGLEKMFYKNESDSIDVKLNNFIDGHLNLFSHRVIEYYEFMGCYFSKLEFEGNWENGVKDGEWLFFSVEGELIRSEKWKMGELIRTKLKK